MRGRSLIPLLVAALLGGVAAPIASADTAGDVRSEIGALTAQVAGQWAGLVTPSGVFRNPFQADAARGHGSFVPPALDYGIHAAGLRADDARLIGAAERTWPNAVNPSRASAFDMLGAAYAYGTLALSGARRSQLAGYLQRYGVPPNGAVCINRPGCYNNLRLVDATTVLAIHALGIASARPGRDARRIVNRRVPQVVDHRLRANLAGFREQGSVLSDPPSDPLAYHALSTFMLGEAVRTLGERASGGARRARRETLDALSMLMAPDGDTSYLGRGQSQVWVPGIAAGALAAGARDALAEGSPRRAGRYLAGALAAVDRLRTRHATADHGLDLVPGASTRTTADGIDSYAHTVAYNGLAMLGLTVAYDALGDVPADLPVDRLPATRRLTVADPEATGLGVVGTGRLWMAVHREAKNTHDLRHDFGLLVLKRRTASGWTDLLAPRPLTVEENPFSGGPQLMRGARAITPVGDALTVRRRTAIVRGRYGRLRDVTFRWRVLRDAVRLTVSGARKGDRFRLIAWTPAGTGAARPREFDAAGATWRFSRPIAVTRLPGFHSAPVQDLDGLAAVLRAPRSGRFTVRIG